MAEFDYPQDLSYTTDHEWVRLDGGRARVGITAYAQDALGDIVYVSLPAVGAALTAGTECGEIESTKSVSAVLAPVSGSVAEVNPELDGAPELVNSDPYGAGWMFEVAVAGDAALDGLMTAQEYRAQHG
jgi:glycine cleavage system H protein